MKSIQINSKLWIDWLIKWLGAFSLVYWLIDWLMYSTHARGDKGFAVVYVSYIYICCLTLIFSRAKNDVEFELSQKAKEQAVSRSISRMRITSEATTPRKPTKGSSEPQHGGQSGISMVHSSMARRQMLGGSLWENNTTNHWNYISWCKNIEQDQGGREWSRKTSSMRKRFHGDCAHEMSALNRAIEAGWVRFKVYVS